MQAQLRSVIESHQILFERIPCVFDLQAAWLLSFAGTRANYLVRALHPNATEEYAVEHDGALRRCLCRLLELDIPDVSWEVANLPFPIGGLGLRNSSRVSPAAYWANWADCLHTMHLRHPVLGDQIEAALSCGEPGQHLHAAVRCRELLLDVGMEAPPWEDFVRGAVPRNDLDDAEPGVKHGWQFQATQKVEDCHWGHVAASFRSILSLVAFPGWPHGRIHQFPYRCAFSF